MIDLVIYPLGCGIYRVEVDGRILLERSRQPLLDGARILRSEGCGPGTRLSMRHSGSEHRSLVSTVGGAAKLTVEESRDRGPRFIPWSAHPRSGVSPPNDFGERPVPGQPSSEERTSDGRRTEGEPP